MRFEDERYIRLYTRKTVTTRKLGWEGRAVWHALLCEFDRAGIVELGEGTAADAVHLLTEIPLDIVRLGLERLASTRTIRLLPGRIFAPRFLEAQESSLTDRARQRLTRERARARARYEALVQDLGPDLAAAHWSEPPADESARASDSPGPSGGSPAGGSENVTGCDIDGTGMAPRNDLRSVTPCDIGQEAVPATQDPASGPVTPRDGSSHDVTIGHILSQPVTPCLTVPNSTDPDSALRIARARASEEPEAGQAARAVARMRRGDHPDRLFSDSVTIVEIGAYVPSPYVTRDAGLAVLSAPDIERVLGDYRTRGRVRAGTQAEHDRRFAKFLAEAALSKDQGADREKRERADHGNSNGAAAEHRSASNGDAGAGGSGYGPRSARALEAARTLRAKYGRSRTGDGK